MRDKTVAATLNPHDIQRVEKLKEHFKAKLGVTHMSSTALILKAIEALEQKEYTNSAN